MSQVRVDNYDGEKGYIGSDKFFVMIKGRFKYLVPEDFFLEGVEREVGLEPVEKTRVYKVVKEVERDTALAEEVKSQRTIDSLVRAYQRKKA